jgi:hypothetical protein
VPLLTSPAVRQLLRGYSTMIPGPIQPDMPNQGSSEGGEED